MVKIASAVAVIAVARTTRLRRQGKWWLREWQGLATDLTWHLKSPARQRKRSKKKPYRPRKAFGTEEAELWRQTDKEGLGTVIEGTHFKRITKGSAKCS
jgi:hypothetical protein